MGGWQKNQLKDAEDLVYLIAMHADKQKGPPSSFALDRWQQELDFYGDAMLLDFGREVMDAYMDANPGPKYTQAVTVIIDRDLTIRRVGGTYDTKHKVNLDLLLELLAE